jgi:hypothetical protein
VGSSLHRLILQEAMRGHDADEDVLCTLLCATAHLEVALGRNHRWSCDAARALLENGAPYFETHRAIAHLSALHGFSEAIPALGQILVLGKNNSCLETCGSLLRMGDAGRLELEAQRPLASGKNLEAIIAAMECLEGKTLDLLDPFLNHPEWQIRASSASLVGSLVACDAVEPGLAIEVLTERIKNETDSDSRWSITRSLARSISKDPMTGIDAVFSGICELDGAPPSDDLMEALSFGVGPDVEPRMFEEMRDLLPEDKKTGRSALNRCLNWIEETPASPLDWICPKVIRLLQWDQIALPPSVAPWFATRPQMEGHLVTTLMHGEPKSSHVASLALRHLDDHPEFMPVLEQAATRAANLGNSEAWDLIGGVIAACRVPSTMAAAELRCALGSQGPVCPKLTPAVIGRLIAISATPLKKAKDAIQLLSQAGPEIREIAHHALVSVPAGARCSSDLGALPPPNGLGPSLSDSSPLGLSWDRQIRPDAFEAGFQQFFGIHPAVWKQTRRPFEGLLVSALHRVDWGKHICNWAVRKQLSQLVLEYPPDLVRKAAVACILSGVQELVGIGEAIASVLPKEAFDGPLEPLLVLARERFEERHPEMYPILGPTNLSSSSDRVSKARSSQI